MKKNFLLLGLLFSMCFAVRSYGQLNGNYAIGPSGPYGGYMATYTSIGNAITALGAGVSGAVVFELQTDYVSAVETFPLAITAITGASASKPITIRPATGASVALNAGTAIAFNLNGCSYVSIDGRAGGAGTARALTINGTGTGATVQLINSANNNKVTYCNITGTSNITITSGLILFSTAASGGGNSNNTISNNDINALGSAVGICSVGTATFENTANTIQNNLIHDFYISSSNTTATYGIRLQTNNSNWTIDGNKFYQTSARDYSAFAASHYVISVETNAILNYHTITNNYIGGNAADGSGTYTVGSTIATTGQTTFIPINLAAASTPTATSVQGNTIKNITVNSARISSSSPGIFAAIYALNGRYNIGTITGNIIGATTGTGSIVLGANAANASGLYAVGINLGTGSIADIQNNSIGSVTTNGNGVNMGTSFLGIDVTSYTAATLLNISNNTIGSTSTANSINISNAITSNAQFFIGIRYASGNGFSTINNNTIANANNSSLAFSSTNYIRGITNAAAASYHQMTNNTIYNLSTTCINTGSGNTASVLGITHSGTNNTTAQAVTGNVIYNLSNNATGTNAVIVHGISLNWTATTSSLTCSNNIIHSLNIPNSTSASATVSGIYYRNGTNCTVANNVIRLGLDAAGTSYTNSYVIRGIHKALTTTEGGLFYNNSVYIGGTGVSASPGANTAAFLRDANQVTSTDDIRNNIFTNVRSNASGSAKHYAINLNSAVIGDINNNVYFANGTGGVLGILTSDRVDLTAWQAATTKDANSFNVNPNFTSSTNLQPTAGNGSIGATIAGITTDITGLARLSPPTIGAYEAPINGWWKSTPATSDWNTATNWVGDVVPTTTAVIPSTSSPMPTIQNDAQIVSLNNNGTITITGPTPFTVTGNITNTGTITTATGTLNLQGGAAQTITTGTGSTITVNNFILNNSFGGTLSGTGRVVVTNIYTPSSGTLNTGGLLTLASSATATAYVAAGTTGYILGNVNVQRYIPGGNRRFRFISHPFNTANNLNVLGTSVSYTGAGGTATGFTHNTITQNPSAFTFTTANADGASPTDAGWSPFTQANNLNPWGVGRGIRLLVRGAFAEGLDGSVYTPSPTTISMTGTINTGDVNVPVVLGGTGATTNFNLIGNPYPSPIRLTDVVLNASVLTNKTVYLRDPVAGAYLTRDLSNVTYNAYAIPANAAFFVIASSAGNITFSESNKVTTASADVVFNQDKGATPFIELTTLADNEVYNNQILKFDNKWNSNFDINNDGPKPSNDFVNAYTLSSDNTRLAVDARPFVDGAVIPLGITLNSGARMLTFKVANVNLGDNYSITLLDKLTNTKTALVQDATYSFTVNNADATTFGDKRFELLLNAKPTVSAVDVAATSFKASIVGSNIVNNQLQVLVSLPTNRTASVTVTNELGQVIATKQANSTGNISFNAAAMSKGLYFVSVQSGDEKMVLKAVKQ